MIEDKEKEKKVSKRDEEVEEELKRLGWKKEPRNGTFVYVREVPTKDNKPSSLPERE
jgi:hypothetical protein